MKFGDAMILAYAKLHSRRVLLLLTILTSSLLFGALYSGTFILNGIQDSLSSLTKEAHHGKYLVKANPVIPQSIYPNVVTPDKKVILDLQNLYSQYVSRAKQIAKDANIAFDESSVKSPLKASPFINSARPADEQFIIDFSSPVYKEYVDNLLKEYAERASNKRQNLKEIASKYGSTGIYTTTNGVTSYSNTVYLQDGKENLEYLLKNSSPMGGALQYGFSINSVQNSSYQMLDDTLLQNWILAPNEKRKANSNDIPVIITTKEATKLFGESLSIPDEPDSTFEKINWIKNLQEKMNGQQFASCYRNDTDRLQVVQAMNAISEMQSNENKKEYIAPKVIYDLPANACGSLTLKKDSRTPTEKKAQQSESDASGSHNPDDKAVSKLLKFQIVGVIDINERSFETPQNIDGLVKNALSNKMDGGAFIPRSLYEKSGAKAEYDDILFGENTKGSESKDVYTRYGLTQSVLAFNTLDNARQFIEKEGCSESTLDCGKLFRLDPFGSNYLLLDDIKNLTSTVIKTALPVVVAFAGVILSFTISRVIVDSRRETAVFRALGASKSDIIFVYGIYGFMVSIIILVMSIAIGLLVSLGVQIQYGATFTNIAHAAYGLFDSKSDFRFIGFSYLPLIAFSLCILTLGLLSLALPLLRNIWRNPINDMREE